MGQERKPEMKDVSKLTAVEILAVTKPEQMFSRDEIVAAIEYRKLSGLWHPDRKPGSDSVFAQISTLYHKGIEKIKTGTWETPGLFTFTDIKGKKFEVRYKKHHVFELGDMYIGDYTITYMIHKDSQDLFDNAKRVIKGFKYANDKMKSEFARYLPEIHTENETADRLVLIVKKTTDLILLSDVLDYLKGKMEPKHVAWVLNTLYNIACYLKFSGLTHNSIGLDSYFISPKQHSGALLGGWWYSAQTDSKIVAVPARTITYAPRDLTSKKIASLKIDSELIRATGRELLGDGNGSKLLSDPNIPNSLLNWVRTAGTGDAYKEYEEWSKKVLKDSFGERRFVELKIQPSDVYKE